MSFPPHDGAFIEGPKVEPAEKAVSAVRYQFRYLPGVVGESQRVVHQAVCSDDVSVWSLCQRQFAVQDVEHVERAGMPCLACVGHAASVAATPFREIGSDGSDPQ